MQRCWNENPADRPSFSDIKSYLEEHLSVDPSNPYPPSTTDEPSSEAAAYRPSNDMEMRDLRPGGRMQKNDYLTLRQSIPVGGYLAPSNPQLLPAAL